MTGDHSVLDLDIGRHFVAITDRDEAVDFIVAEQHAVHERSVGTSKALFAAAGNDPQLDGYLDGLIAGIGRQVRRLLQVCADRGWLRTDITFDEVVETAIVISSIETYDRIVHRDGWTDDAYRNWFRRMLHETVFERTATSSTETDARR